MQISYNETTKLFTARFPFDRGVLKALKDNFSETKWDAGARVWTFPLNGRNLNRVLMESGQNPFNFGEVVKTGVTGGASAPYPFLPHQSEIYDFIMDRKQCVIAGQMRTGKTYPTLVAASTFSDGGEVWYIAPKSALRGVKREFKKWLKADFRGDKLTLGSEKRLGFRLTLLSYTKWALILTGETLSELVPKVVILDEIHKVKSDKSNIGKLSRQLYIAQLNKFGSDFLLVGLSGTPAPKNPADWWNILETVAPGYSPYSSKAIMEQDLAYCTLQEAPSGHKYWQVESWREDDVNKFSRDYLVNKISLPIFKDEVLDLPEKVHEYIDLEPSQETKDTVKFLLEVEKTKIGLINKSRQISDGFMYDTSPDEINGVNVRNTEYISTPKNAQLVKDLTRLREQGVDRVIVLAAFKASVDIVADICISEGWETIRIDGRGYLPLNTAKTSDDYLEEFDRSTRKSPDFLAIVGHPKSVSTGLELSAAPVMIYWSHTNDGEAEMQSIERAHSMNMDIEKGLTIKHYCHLKIDKLIIKSLQSKEGLQGITMGSILDKLKEEIAE